MTNIDEVATIVPVSPPVSICGPWLLERLVRLRRPGVVGRVIAAAALVRAVVVGVVEGRLRRGIQSSSRVMVIL